MIKSLKETYQGKSDPGDFFVGPVLTVTAASPHEENGPILTSLPLVNCVDRLGEFKVAASRFHHFPV